MYEGHTNALTAMLVILPTRWAGVALQPLSVPFGPTGITHTCHHHLDEPEGYIYKVDHCARPSTWRIDGWYSLLLLDLRSIHLRVQVIMAADWRSEYKPDPRGGK